ncbi:MAG: hypothetical protein J0L96_07995 [Anaerolineae bacterium]|nr:hypothetical protein [Anaerolineae bacterium]
MNKQTNLNFWWRWLVAADIIVIVFGAAQALLPDLIRQGFSLLVFGSASYVDTFPQDAIRYITLTHAVMGSAMIGWGVSMMYTLLTQFRNGEWTGWISPAVALILWFIPDTTISIVTGFWQNAVFNIGFILLFAIPLAATYKTFRAK